MPMNQVQFLRGVSVPEFFERYGTEVQCAAALVTMRWPGGFRRRSAGFCAQEIPRSPAGHK